MSQDSGPASYFAQLSRELLNQGTERPTLQAVVERAVEVVPACDHASITIRRRNRHNETVASTSEAALRADALQYELEEGPCLESVAAGSIHWSNDLARESRWPAWSRRVAEDGMGSVLSVQLSTERDVIGALNLYAERADAFDQDQMDLALVFTTHATNALATTRMVSGLRTAVDSRHRIGVAQGILMVTYGITMEQSFELMRRYSNDGNLKLRDVADHVVEQGRLPEAAED